MFKRKIKFDEMDTIHHNISVVDNKYILIELLKNNEVLASVIIKAFPRTHNTALENLNVEKKYRRQGLANKLMTIAIEEYHPNYLIVKKRNKKAIKLFKKFGFIVTSYDKEEKYYIMRMPIKFNV